MFLIVWQNLLYSWWCATRGFIFPCNEHKERKENTILALALWAEQRLKKYILEMFVRKDYITNIKLLPAFNTSLNIIPVLYVILQFEGKCWTVGKVNGLYCLWIDLSNWAYFIQVHVAAASLLLIFASSRPACHILECSEGLAQEVISTIGQAFELRFKQYLKNPPKLVTPHDR